MHRTIPFLFVIAAWLLVMPNAAEAYIGPGAGITAIGTVIAFLGAIVFAIVGFIWYPVKRLLASMRNKDARGTQTQKAS